MRNELQRHPDEGPPKVPDAPYDLKERTKAFALRVVRLVEALPRSAAAEVMGKQLLRCATSVGANYRAACRARSKAEFLAKLGIVEEETDEAVYWMEVLVDSGIVKQQRVQALMEEGNALLSIIIASIRTTRHSKR